MAMIALEALGVVSALLLLLLLLMFTVVLVYNLGLIAFGKY